MPYKKQADKRAAKRRWRGGLCPTREDLAAYRAMDRAFKELPKRRAKAAWESVPWQVRYWLYVLALAHQAEANRERKNAKNRRRVDRNRLFVAEHLAARCCEECGETDTSVLEFIHLRDKRATVSDLVQSGKTLNVIVREMRKCRVLCSNCRRRALSPPKFEFLPVKSEVHSSFAVR